MFFRCFIFSNSVRILIIMHCKDPTAGENYPRRHVIHHQNTPRRISDFKHHEIHSSLLPPYWWYYRNIFNEFRFIFKEFRFPRDFFNSLSQFFHSADSAFNTIERLFKKCRNVQSLDLLIMKRQSIDLNDSKQSMQWLQYFLMSQKKIRFFCIALNKPVNTIS